MSGQITRITQTRFVRFRQQFFKTLQCVPSECTLIFTSKAESTGQFTNFTGESDRVKEEHTVKCLYKREFSANDRVKYGLHEDVSGVVYVAPTDLVDALGTFKIDKRKFSVLLNEINYIVDTVIFRGPFYNSCIAVEIRVKDPDRGG